jgi:hypothetical protein
LIFGNARLLEYRVLVWLLFHLFVLVYEEPILKASFGACAFNLGQAENFRSAEILRARIFFAARF